MPVAARFHTLTIAEIRREAPDAVAVRFALPYGLAEAFTYIAGQYLTLRREFCGEELRRCYSLCAAPGGSDLWIGVREEQSGRFSGWLNQEAQVGDKVDSMPPDGRFTYKAQDDCRDLLLVAAGSGITPVLGIAEAALTIDPSSNVTLIYANRDAARIMFRERLNDLKDRYLNRFRVFHVLSREPSEVELATGRIDDAKCERFFSPGGIAPAEGFDRAYLCGPETMMDVVSTRLEEYGLPASEIRRELFLNADSPTPPGRTRRPSEPTPEGAQVTVILDQRRRTFVFDPAESSILDAARSAGIDVPFACKAGVCATCRAHLSEGKVAMARNQALDQSELERGFVLTCQSRPQSAALVIDYDRRSG